MLKRDRALITSNFVLLTNEIPCMHVLNCLHQDEIISSSMVLEILEKPASSRNCHLLLLLERRGPNAFNSFINALKKANRHDLVDVLCCH